VEEKEGKEQQEESNREPILRSFAKKEKGDASSSRESSDNATVLSRWARPSEPLGDLRQRPHTASLPNG
jgi:hypothetical protein